MEKYTLNKYDFKKFLLNELPDARQEELIFWKKGIPLPVDLVYDIFEKRGKLLAVYLDHLTAAYIFIEVCRSEGINWQAEVEKMPAEVNRSQSGLISKKFSNCISRSKVEGMASELAEGLMMQDYVVDISSLVNALCHEGRKYKRLYIPFQLKSIIRQYNGDMLTKVGITNGDMFGNVVADELGIYRSGFSDAFSVIFNKLLDFILQNHTAGNGRSSSASQIRIKQFEKKDFPGSEVSFGVVNDGSIWEPRYVNGETTCILNKNHPFMEIVKRKGKGAEEVIGKVASLMSEIENETIRDGERRVIEILRQELSRRLRLITENELNNQ